MVHFDIQGTRGFRQGWYEFVKHPQGTTHIMHVGESSYYFPEDGVTLDDFLDSVNRGRAYRLIRLVDVEKNLGVTLDYDAFS